MSRVRAGIIRLLTPRGVATVVKIRSALLPRDLQPRVALLEAEVADLRTVLPAVQARLDALELEVQPLRVMAQTGDELRLALENAAAQARASRRGLPDLERRIARLEVEVVEVRPGEVSAFGAALDPALDGAR